MVETYPWCRGDVRFHCSADSACRWVRCEDCKVTIDPNELRAYDKTGAFLEWPHAKPKSD